jgi:RNA polymerase sigma-70 factor (ECF subfamily)
MERVANGDSRALAELHDRFAGLLIALGRRIVGSQEEAEDLVQDVFVQAWRQAARYDPVRSSVSTWLVLITRSRAIDRVRTRQVAERTTQAANQESSGSYASARATGAVLHRERRIRLQEELARLPVEQREVLELAFYQGLTQSEISGQTGIPLGTVKTRTLLAMRKLRNALADEIGELL